MNTTENNKLIAEFMGIHEIMLDGYSNYEIDVIYEILGIKPHAHKGLIIHESDLQFHTSWEWLMPVVEKIEDIGCELTQTNGECTISFDDYYNETSSKTRFHATYQAVVEFIEWYNEQNRFICGSCGERCNSYEYNEKTDVDECPDCRIKTK